MIIEIAKVLREYNKFVLKKKKKKRKEFLRRCNIRFLPENIKLYTSMKKSEVGRTFEITRTELQMSTPSCYRFSFEVRTLSTEWTN